VKEPRAQLPALPLQLRDPLRVVGRGARPDAAVDLGLGHPVAQRLGIDAQLLADPGQRPGAVAGSRRASSAIRVALSRSSSGYLLGAAMTLILPANESLHQSWRGTCSTGRWVEVAARGSSAEAVGWM
jgi:hypothetical protein